MVIYYIAREAIRYSSMQINVQDFIISETY